MRSIKFRAWSEEQKVMLDWKHISQRDSGLEFVLAGGHSDNVLVPMQFTGLTDKNGKEMYEGDIVKVRALADFDTCVGEEIDFIAFDSVIGCFCFYKGKEFCGLTVEGLWRRYKVNHLEFKVIGNIYESSQDQESMS